MNESEQTRTKSRLTLNGYGTATFRPSYARARLARIAGPSPAALAVETAVHLDHEVRSSFGPCFHVDVEDRLHVLLT